MTRLGVNGAAGRMGQTVIETASERDDVSVAFGIDVDSDADTEVPLYAPDETADALSEHEPDAIIDFTVPDSTVALAEACADAGVALVVGTTGIDEDQLSVLQEASEAVPLLKATNFSRGIQGLLRALGPALEALDGYDVEVMETHHNQKQDAPSGTAKTILEEVSEHRDFETVAGREGIQPREDGEVGMLVRRAGDIRGEHEVILADNDEVLSISHRAEDRAVFAAGAIDAAMWLTEQDAGWYGFDDVVDEG
jgi:4-hydroxy-tetrahydrodipicolinate reductase